MILPSIICSQVGDFQSAKIIPVFEENLFYVQLSIERIP